MPQTYNQIHIEGRLTKDLQLKPTGDNRSVMNIYVVTDEGYMDKTSGQWVEKPTFHNCVSFKDQLNKNRVSKIKKGDFVRVVGSLHKSKYTPEDGIERESAEIVVEKLDLLFRAKANQTQQASSQQDEPGSAYDAFENDNQGQPAYG
jgi:single-strand DNA-binding protein